MVNKKEEILAKYFGYSSFREGQAETITSIMDRHHTLAIMPTGGGKSICYQIPAMLQKGVTIVISPLISLMKDQVDGLTAAGIPATYINSSLSASEQEEVWMEIMNNHYQLVYIAPERIESYAFQRFTQQVAIDLIVFDEAHCISQWGHDFRPSYRSAVSLLKSLVPEAVYAALTATATETVKHDIQELLSIRDEHCIVTGFARDNLSFQVVKGQNKRQFLKSYLQAHGESAGIIYTATRKQADSLYDQLQAENPAVYKYHAGLSERERKQSQQAFIHEDHALMIATNAFGMGIDKPNVRFVIHYAMPMQMEAYYQEAGRAGRDGEASDCILLYSPQDVQLQKFLIEQGEKSEALQQQEYEKLQAMTNYCHTDRCLADYILHYFMKDHQDILCEKCSNCVQREEKIDITREAQMILSCVKRMDERFGVTLIAKVLRGSKDKRITQFHFQKLTTYGILKQYTETEIVERIQFLIAEQLLSLQEGKFPTVQLNSRSVDVLKGKKQVYFSPIIVQSSTETVDYPEALFEELRQLRKQLADRAGIPPYAVFPDLTLKEMARYLPTTEEDMLAIKGVGAQKLGSYGALFMEVISDYREKHPESKPKIAIHSASPSARGTEKTKTIDGPSHMETYRLYQNGKSIKMIAQMRGLTEQTIENHLFKAYQDGHPILWETIFSEEEEMEILTVYDKTEDKRLKEIKEKLPETYTYFTIKAVLIKNEYIV